MEREGEGKSEREGEMRTPLGVLIPARRKEAGGGTARRRRPSGRKEEEEKEKEDFPNNPLDLIEITDLFKVETSIIY